MTILAAPADLDALETYQFQIAHHAPRTVACTRCKAQPGRFCTGPNGNVPYHKPRKVAVERLSTAEKVAAVEAMRRTLHAARTAPLPPLTPAQALVRAATSDAWDNVTSLAAIRAQRGRPTSPEVA